MRDIWISLYIKLDSWILEFKNNVDFGWFAKRVFVGFKEWQKIADLILIW